MWLSFANNSHAGQDGMPKFGWHGRFIEALTDAKSDTSLAQAQQKVASVMSLLETSHSVTDHKILKSFTDPADVVAKASS